MPNNLRLVRVNKFNEELRKRKSRNLRSSSWVTSAIRKQKRGLIQKQGDFVVSNSLLTTLHLITNIEKYGESDLVNYLKENYKVLKRVIMQDASKKGVKGDFRINLEKEEVPLMFLRMKEDGIDSKEAIFKYSRDVAKKIFEGESLNIKKTVSKKVQSYFRERKIPLDLKLFNLVLDNYLSKTTFAEDLIQKRINFSFLEKEYLMLRKETRKRELMFKQGSNEIIREALVGLRLTNRQVTTARNWVQRENKKYAEEFQKKLSLLVSDATKGVEEKISKLGVAGNKVDIPLKTMDEITRAGDEIRTRQKADLREFMISTMKIKKKVANSSLVRSSSSIQKVGAREERMKLYSPRSKESNEVRSNMEKMESVKSAAKKVGAGFNSLNYSINGISKSNSELGKLVGDLLKRKELSASSVEKLYIKGNLAQVSFFRAIKEFKFVEKFGTGSLDSLAKIISTIGPEFPPIGRVNNSVRDGSGPRIIDFLVKTKLAEDTHRGGACIGLTR